MKQLEPTTGLLFSLAVIENKNPLSFLSAFRLVREFFTKEEQRILDVMSKHVELYKEIPTKSLIEIETGYTLPDLPIENNIQFWADEVRKRYAVENSFSLCKEAMSKISDGDIDSAADIASKLTRILIEGQTKTKVYSVEDIIDNVLDMHDKARLNIREFGVPFGLEFLDEKSGGAQGGDLVTIAGRPGCLSGDTTINILRGSRDNYREYSLRDAYYRFNGLLQEGVKKGVNQRWRSGKSIDTFIMSCGPNGEIIRNKIKDIYFSGTKEVYKVTTRSGLSIKATKDHRFYIGNSNYSSLENLKIGDTLITYSNKTTTEWVYKTRHKVKSVCGILFHPFAAKHVINGKDYKRLDLSRLIVEANMNNLSIDKYISVLKTEESIASTLIFLDPSLQIHHKDLNHLNNNLDNLMVLTVSEHSYLHGRSTAYDINGVSGLPDTIESILPVGEEDTFDIEMESAPFNFRANDFFVHNSAKTFLLIHMALAAHAQGSSVLFIPTEMSEIQYHRRIIALRNNLNIDRIKFGLLTTTIGKEIIKYDKQILTETPNKFYMTDASMSLGILDIKSSAYVYKPDAIYIDGAYLLKPEFYAKSRYEIVSSVAESLKTLAKELNIPIFATYQLNKKTEDIYQSDVVRQLSSIVIELSNYEDTTGQMWNETQKAKLLKITKGRDGEDGNTVIILDTEHTRLIEAENTDRVRDRNTEHIILDPIE